MTQTTAEYNRAWYAKNKDKRKKLNQAWRDKQRLALQKLREGIVCTQCGESRTPCLDFHHIDPETKEISLSQAISNGWSTARMKREIEKCIVLCANCHRMEHHNLRTMPL